MPRRCRIELLGRFRVVIDGYPIPDGAWKHKRAADLVKLLALAPRRWLKSEQLTDTLWPELSAEAGAANVRKAAHFARKILGFDESIVLTQGDVRLLPSDETTTDLEEFEHAMGMALRASNAAEYARAAEMYRGELLPQDRYRAWTEEPRERLRLRYHFLLHQAESWERLLEEDPTNEEASRALMRQQADAGNRAGALMRYQRLKAILAQEAGAAPQPATVALYEEISMGPAAVAPVALSPPIVGRDGEVRRLRTMLDLALSGHGAGVILAGEAGVGKTRLCEGVLAEAAAAGASTLRGAAREQESAVPFAPIIEAVERALLQRPDLAGRLTPSASAELSRLTTSLAGDAQAGEAPGDPRRIISAVAQLIAAAARERGTIFLVEDLHAADQATLQLLSFLVRAARFQRLLLVMSYRAEDTKAPLQVFRSGMLEQRDAVEIHLGPLGREAARQIIERLAPAAPSEQTKRAIWTMAGGNPFFIEELARGIAADGSVQVPAELYDVLGGRLSRLAPETRRVLESLAVAGLEFDAGDFAAAAGVDDDTTSLERLDQALRSGVIEEYQSGYRFRHVLVRDALERSLPQHRQRALQGKAADRLSMTGAPPARVAHHLVRAGRDGEAIVWLERAARQAASVGALTDGLQLVEQALALGSGLRPLKLVELRAGLLYAAGRGEAAAAYAEALERVPRQDRTGVAVKLARAHLAAGDPDSASKVLAEVEPDGEEERARVLLAQGLAALRLGDLDGAERCGEEARRLAIARRMGREVGEASALLAMVAHMQGRWRARFRREFMDILQHPELAAQVFDAHMCFAEFALHGQEPHKAIARFAHELHATAARAGVAHAQAIASLMIGEVELLSGQLDRAEIDLERAMSLLAQVGVTSGQALAGIRRGEASLARGRAAEALAQLNHALAISRDSTLASHLVVRAYAGLTRAALGPAQLDTVGQAEAELAGSELCEPCSMGFLLAAARALAGAGNQAHAQEYLEHAEGVATMWQGGSWDTEVAGLRASLKAGVLSPTR